MIKKDSIYGLGRRKTAVARVYLTNKPEEKLINGLALESYFTTIALQNIALHPLQITSKQEDFGLSVKVFGGGKHAQSEAVRLGIARALLVVDADYRKQLKQAGMLTRDSRMKERKKPGLKGARRAPQFSKR